MTVAQRDEMTTEEKVEAWNKLKAKQEKDEARKRKWRRALAVLGGLLALSCIAFCAFSFLAVGRVPEPPKAPEVPATQAAAAQVVVPTQTPTLTPYVPAATAMPMSTLVSTAIPVVGEGEGDLEYANTMASLLDRYSRAFFTLSETAGQMRFDASGDFASSWKTEMALIFAEVLVIGAEMREVQPPPRLEEAHGLLREATEHCDAGVFLFAEGIDSLNADLIDQAAEEFNLATQLIEDFTEVIVSLSE